MLSNKVLQAAAVFTSALLSFVHASPADETNATNRTVIFEGGTNNRNIGINNGTVNTYVSASNLTFIVAPNTPITFPRNATGKIAELKDLAQTREFRDAMEPFITLGLGQPKGTTVRIESGLDKRPMSYAALLQAAAFEPGEKGQHRLVIIAQSKENDRPNWPMKSTFPANWRRNEYQRTLVSNAQKYFQEYGREMVEVGMLAK